MLIPDIDETSRSGLLELIRETFPAEPFHGEICRSDETHWTPDGEEGQDLIEALKGRSWTAIPPEFLQQNPDGYVLLASEARVAFLAAWLTCSLDGLESYNEVRDMLYICFGSNAASDFVAPLNEQQRFTLCALLEYFSHVERFKEDRYMAASALEEVQEVIGAELRNKFRAGGTKFQ